MKQRRATIEEAEELLRWLQEQEAVGNAPPPYAAVVFGYITMHDNCADTDSDVLEFSPRIQEAFAALEREQTRKEGA